MSEIELVVGETRVLARGARTHWEVVPSVVPSSDGLGVVVGEPLTRQGHAASVVQHGVGDRIALRPATVPSVAEATAAVLGSVFDNLRVSVPCDRISVVCPTIWGERECGVFATAAAGFAHEVLFEEVALRASELDPATRRSRRTVVIEFGLLSTAVSTVTYDHQGAHIENCTYEPNFGSEDLRGEVGSAGLAEILNRAVTDRPADVIQIFGTSDPAVLGHVTAGARDVFGADIQVSVFSDRDLLRPPSAERSLAAGSIVPAAPEWMQPLRARAATIDPPSRTPLYLAAAAAVVVVGIGAAAAVVALTGSAESADAAATTATTSATSSASVAPSRTPTATRTTTASLGKLVSTVPADWTRTNDSARLVFTPDVGSGGRIIVTAQPIEPGFGYAEVAADLDAKAAKRPAGSVTRIQRDAVVGQRTGLSYEEHPADGSTVRWLVMLESGTQVSVGCQFLPGVRDRVMAACETVVNSVRITG